MPISACPFPIVLLSSATHLLYKLLSACLVVALGFLESSRPGPGHPHARCPCSGLMQDLCSLHFLSVPKAAVPATGGMGWHQKVVGRPGSTAALQARERDRVPQEGTLSRGLCLNFRHWNCRRDGPVWSSSAYLPAAPKEAAAWQHGIL